MNGSGYPGGMMFVFAGQLGDFFVTDHEAAPWLYRLAVLRHDLTFEMENLRTDGTDASTVRLLYFLRRISVTVLEVKNILGHEARTMLKRQRDVFPADVVAEYQKAYAILETAEEMLRPIRDSLGGHLRPESHVKGKDHDYLRRLVSTFGSDGENRFTATIDLRDGSKTDMGRIAFTAFHAIWPEVAAGDPAPDADDLHPDISPEDRAYARKHRELQMRLLPALRACMAAIDNLLYLHWRANPEIACTEAD